MVFNKNLHVIRASLSISFTKSLKMNAFFREIVKYKLIRLKIIQNWVSSECLSMSWLESDNLHFKLNLTHKARHKDFHTKNSDKTTLNCTKLLPIRLKYGISTEHENSTHQTITCNASNRQNKYSFAPAYTLAISKGICKI